LEDLRSIFLIDSLKDFVEWAPFWPSLPCGESAEGVARFTFYKFEVWPATHGIQAMTGVLNLGSNGLGFASARNRFSKRFGLSVLLKVLLFCVTL
jgi:hypothetical protein